MRSRNFRRGVMPALLGIAALLLLTGQPALAQIRVDVNGQPVAFREARPVMMQGRVFIPLRDVAESLDAHVTWDPVTRTVQGSRNDRSFTLPVGSRTARSASRRKRWARRLPGTRRSSGWRSPCPGSG
jgi:hypothetical protein